MWGGGGARKGEIWGGGGAEIERETCVYIFVKASVCSLCVCVLVHVCEVKFDPSIEQKQNNWRKPQQTNMHGQHIKLHPNHLGVCFLQQLCP